MTTPKWAKDGAEKVGNFAEVVNNKIDTAADNAIDAVQAKTGRYTWAAILGVVVAIIGVFALVWIL